MLKKGKKNIEIATYFYLLYYVKLLYICIPKNYQFISLYGLQLLNLLAIKIGIIYFNNRKKYFLND